MKITSRRVRITESPFFPEDASVVPGQRGRWPAFWLQAPRLAEPAVFVYRLRFSIARTATVRVHVSADERYALYLDGVRIGRGPERCDLHAWRFETYDLRLPAGKHTLVARVSVLRDSSPYAQMSIEPGFFLVAEDQGLQNLLTSGFAPWEIKQVAGYAFASGEGFDDRCAGTHEILDGRQFPWGYLQGKDSGWEEAKLGLPGFQGDWHAFDVPVEAHRMQPAALPAMLEKPWRRGKVVCLLPELWEAATPLALKKHVEIEIPLWNRLLRRGSQSPAIKIPAQTARTVLIDAEDYLCAYPNLVVSGGRDAEISLRWAESLFKKETGWEKGNRDEVEGKYFRAMPDRWICDGGSQRHLDTLWWRAGRYLLLTIQTADAPLELHELSFSETRYPLEMESLWKSEGYPVAQVLQPSIRAMQMCAHETYMDCPYFEQLMYAGDTRTEVLTTYAMTRDNLLPRKAIELFNSSRRPWGLTQSRYPCRVRQEIPPFSLWWIAMVHDYAMWRGDRDFIRGQMAGIRGVIDAWESLTNRAGLVQAPPGWAFVDWVPEWNTGIPPGAERGVSSILNWHFVYTLRRVALLETWLGELEHAERANRRAREIAAKIHATFWSKKHGLYSDDVEKKHFSEHAQCLAILGGAMPGKTAGTLAKTLFSAPDLAQATIYFSHYLFETCQSTGRMDVFWKRLSLWSDLEKNGFKTTFEMPEPTRSDCHAWAAHPLYHFYASVLGIRPGNFGFTDVQISPSLGPLKHVSASLVHPLGEIDVELEAAGKALTRGRVRLPAGATGQWRGRQKLRPRVWNDVSG